VQNMPSVEPQRSRQIGGRWVAATFPASAVRVSAVRRVIYVMNPSLDGYVEGPDGKFDWSRPDEEIHRFHNRLADQVGTFLLGRRMYETMRVWQTMDEDSSLPEFVLEFARIWKSKPKIVFSRTLKQVDENYRLVQGDVSTETRRLKEESGGDLAVSGPTLSSALGRSGLIDEYHLVIYPVLVGGGKSYFSPLPSAVSLRLLESRTFSSGAVYLRYEVTGRHEPL
jgi:dihydrofolate reductase